MSVLDESSIPYPGQDVPGLHAKRVARLTPENTAVAAWFTPATATVAVDVSASAAVAPAQPAATLRRVPGATLVGPPPPSFTPYAPELLERVAHRIRHLDDAPVAAPAAAVAPDQPPVVSPVAVLPVGEPEAAAAGWPEGVVRGLLIGALWDAAQWYAGMAPDSCDDCWNGEELCAFHRPRCVKALEYEQLHDVAAQAQADSAAIYGIAVAIRTGDAELGDIASPGSPLEGLLLARLERLDAEGQR